MTDKELIKAVQCCTSESDFERCKLECIFCKSSDPNDCIPEMGKAVAAKLEALLAENERLKQDMQVMKYGFDLLKSRTHTAELPSTEGVE